MIEEKEGEGVVRVVRETPYRGAEDVGMGTGSNGERGGCGGVEIVLARHRGGGRVREVDLEPGGALGSFQAVELSESKLVAVDCAR